MNNPAIHTHTPQFVEPLLDAHRARKSAFLVEHTGDFVLSGSSVMPLEVYVPELFRSQQGYELVVTYSLARGVELYGTAESDRERQERILRQISGIRLCGDDSSDPARLGGDYHRHEETLRGLDRLLRQAATPVAVVIYNIDRIVPQVNIAGVQSPEQLAIEEICESWGASPDLRATQNIIIGLTRDVGKVSGAVSKSFVCLSEPLPGCASIRSFLDEMGTTGVATNAFGRLEDGVSADAFANLATGLRLKDIEAIFRKAAAKDGMVSASMVRDEKSRVITQLADGALMMMEPLKGGFLGLAGMDHVVSDLQEIARLLRENPASSRLPRAMLFLGPPGTGKSSLARAIAAEAGGINVVALGEVMGSYVGESERRMDNVFRVLKGMAPVICFIDEVDTAFVSRGEASGDSGVSKRVLGKVLAALGDEQLRGKVLFVLASNRGDLLDAALLRRAQKVYLISTPGQTDREKILLALAARDGRQYLDDVRLSEVAEKTAGCTGADLEKILARAAEMADYEAGIDDTPLAVRHLAAALADYKSNADPHLYEFFDLSAIRTCPFLTGIPWHTPDRGLNHPDCPAHVRRMLKDDGSIDVRELNHRIHELANLCALDRQGRQIG